MTPPARCGRCAAARPRTDPPRNIAPPHAEPVWSEETTPEDRGWAPVRDVPLYGGGVLRVTVCPACLLQPTPGTVPPEQKSDDW